MPCSRHRSRRSEEGLRRSAMSYRKTNKVRPPAEKTKRSSALQSRAQSTRSAATSGTCPPSRFRSAPHTRRIINPRSELRTNPHRLLNNHHPKERLTTPHVPPAFLQIRRPPPADAACKSVTYLRLHFAYPLPVPSLPLCKSIAHVNPGTAPSRLANPSLVQRHGIMRGTRAYGERLRPLERDQEND